jgi:hypothetical protein
LKTLIFFHRSGLREAVARAGVDAEAEDIAAFGRDFGACEPALLARVLTDS